MVFSQTIKGKIMNSQGMSIPVANVVIKDSSNTDIIKEFAIASNGEYFIEVKNNYKKLVVEVSANRYLKDFFEIATPAKDQVYIHDFILLKDSGIRLNEVTVKAKVRPFQVEGDTVKYTVAGYRDGSERKIQDLIKKLPGMEVNERTGEIRYKGRSIETVKLDGDDLFGANYAIGTKNINVEMVEQVQAIENYSDNPLLKGIENGDKVAINLKLKKNKLDLSGSTEFGTGIFANGKAAYDASTNILGVSKKYKSFGTASYNNVGINNSPFDYFAYTPSAEQLKEGEFQAKKIIPEFIFSSALDDRRANINNALFANYNQVFKVGKRLSIKSNLFYINDRIMSDQSSLNNNLVNNQAFITFDRYAIKKQPRLYRGDVEVKFNASTNSLLEYKLKISSEPITTLSNIVQNDLINFQTILTTTNINFRHSLLFTKKIAERKAFQLLLNQSVNNIRQSLFLSPAVYSPQLYDTEEQASNFKKNTANLQATYLGSTNKIKYTLSLGASLDNNPFQSGLTGINSRNEHIISGFTNRLSYKKANTYHSGNYNIILGKWKISPSWMLTYLHQSLANDVDSIRQTSSHFLVEPSLTTRYSLNNVSGISATVRRIQRPFSEQYQFDNPVYTSNRTVVSNQPGLQLQKAVAVGGLYYLNNLYKQFQLNAGVNFIKNQGNYFSDVTIQSNSTYIAYFYLPQSNGTINFNFMVEKFVPFLESTIRLKSNYNISNYKNIVNSSDLRINRNDFMSAELFMKTAFDIKVNFENVLQYKSNRANSAGMASFTNKAVNNSFKIIARPSSKYLLLLSGDYYLPDTKKGATHFLFLDASVRYTPKNKRFDLSFSAKNITNTTFFRQVETTDFSTIIYQASLIPANYMVSVSYSF